MYKIIIEKIEEKMVEENNRTIISEVNGEKEYGYVKIPNIELVSKQIYTQTIDKEGFDIKKVIDAFNQ